MFSQDTKKECHDVAEKRCLPQEASIPQTVNVAIRSFSVVTCEVLCSPFRITGYTVCLL